MAGMIEVGRSCLEKNVRETVAEIVKQDINALPTLLNVFIPDCANVPKAAKEAAKREMPALWGVKVTYLNEKCEEKEFDSPSAVLKALNIPTSGTICDPSGEKCRSTSQIESLRIKGYTVWGDGEGQEPVKGVSKHITIIHPNCAESKIKKK